MKCQRCNKEVEAERVELELTICKECAFGGFAQKKYKGQMAFDSKTSPELNIMTAESFENFKSYMQPVGHGSGVHKVSPATEFI